MKRRTFLSSGLAAAALTPHAVLAQNRNYQQPLTIGINASLSTEAGHELIAGVQIAVDYANQFTPMLNSAFALRMFDDQGQYAQSINNIQFAGADPTVIGLIGGLDGTIIAQSLPIYANGSMPLMVPASTANDVTARGYRVVWRLPTKDSTEGQLFARFVAQRAKPKMAIAVSQDGVYGADVMNGFTNQAHSAKFDADGYHFPSSSPDYKAAASRIISRSPDLVFLCGQSAQLGPLIPALRAAGYTGKFGASEGFYNIQTAKDYAGAFADGFISTSFPPLQRLASTTQELINFRSRTSVTIVSAFAYAAAQVMMSAVRRTGATNRLATLTALQSPSMYNTILGPFQFDFSGDPIDPNLYFYSIKDGQFVYVAPSHATAAVF
jgi:branched-chain amino acid transport system substrate-binding protein